MLTNDDIKQKLTFSLNPLCINIMTNEMFNKEKLFIPKNYKIYLNALSQLPNDDIFNLNNNYEFLTLLKEFKDNDE